MPAIDVLDSTLFYEDTGTGSLLVFLASSDDVPKLLLTFDTSPTLMIGAELTAWCATNIASLEIEQCGAAGHQAPEDQPEAIAAAIARWADR